MRRQCWFSLALMAGLLLLVDAAHAQTIDTRPVVNSVLDWLSGAALTVATVGGGVIIRLLLAKIGLANSDLERSLNERLDFIAHKAIEFTMVAAQNEVAKKGAGLGAVKVDNWFIKVAADMLARQAPDIIAKFSLSRQQVEDFILSRIPAHFPMAASVTPDAVAGGVASSPVAKAATLETGAPSSAKASVTPGTAAIAPGSPAVGPTQDSSGTLG